MWCLLVFIKLCEGKYQKEKKKSYQQLEHWDLVLLRQSEKYFKLACADVAAERLGADVSEIFRLLAQGRAKENVSPRKECVDVPRNCKEDFVGKEVNSREKRRGCARDADFCQVTLSVELASGWAKLGLVGSCMRQQVIN